MSKKLFVFDLDETLIAGDSCVEWHRFLVERGIATAPDFLEEDQRLMNLYAEGTLDMQEYLDFGLAPLANIPCEEVDKLVAECARTRVLPIFYPLADKMIEGLKRDNIDRIIISATPGFVVTQVARLLGVDTAMGIDLVIKDGVYSSEMDGICTFRSGKVDKLKHWLNENNHSYDSIEFYTDSINDLPLCEYADVVHAINPCQKLKVVAKAQSWNIHSWTL